MKSPVEKAIGLQELVRQNATQSEQQRHLCANVARAFADAGLYRIAAPAEYGGEEADPATQIATIEAVSYADGSAGWNLMIGIETFGLLAPGFGKCPELIANPATIMCSSTAAVGRAERVQDGYIVDGRWSFVSGCHNSDLFGATVRLYENGEPVPERGNLYAMVAKPEFEILDTWHVGGLRGSGSHDVQVTGRFVPDDHIVAPIGGTRGDSPLLAFPLAARLAYNKVAVALGIARAAIDAFVDLATDKTPKFSNQTLRHRPIAHEAIAAAEVRVRGARALMLELVAEFWDDVSTARRKIDRRRRAIFQIAASDAARGCYQAVETLCEAAGTSANQIGQPLERLARDIRVVRQHLTVAPQHMADGGRVLLGLEPENAILKYLK